MNIQKIEKPCNGWTIEYLKNYNFTFTSSNVINCKNLVITILNNYLSYFYYVEKEKNNVIYINEEYVIIIHQASLKNYFNHDMLKSIVKYHVIPIDVDIINQIEEDEKKEQKFQEEWKEYLKVLNEQHKIKEQQYQEEQRKKVQQKKDTKPIEKNEKGGIYGIYSIDANQIGQLLYIGLTNRSFNARWEEHKAIINGESNIPDGMKRLYNLLMDESRTKYLQLKPLVYFNEIEANRPLTQSDKEAMEMFAISYFHPPGNTAGTIIPYRFSDAEK